MRSIAHEFSLSSQIIVQSASEMRASNTKTRKKQNKQIAVNRLVFDTSLCIFVCFLPFILRVQCATCKTMRN